MPKSTIFERNFRLLSPDQAITIKQEREENEQAHKYLVSYALPSVRARSSAKISRYCRYEKNKSPITAQQFTQEIMENTFPKFLGQQRLQQNVSAIKKRYQKKHVTEELQDYVDESSGWQGNKKSLGQQLGDFKANHISVNDAFSLTQYEAAAVMYARQNFGKMQSHVTSPTK